MGCPWLPYCMLLLSPQINREHKFHPGPGPADTLPSPVRLLKISRKEDGMRWSRSCWYNQKKLYTGVFIMSHCTLPFIFFLFTDSFMLPIARVGQSDLMRWSGGMTPTLLRVLAGHQHSSSHHPGLKTNFHSRPRARVRRNIIWETRTIPLILLKP